jgi:hypothetical protein
LIFKNCKKNLNTTGALKDGGSMPGKGCEHQLEAGIVTIKEVGLSVLHPQATEFCHNLEQKNCFPQSFQKGT